VEAETVNVLKYRLCKIGLIKTLFSIYADLTGTGSVPMRMWTWCYARWGQRGLPAPVRTHWIRLHKAMQLFLQVEAALTNYPDVWPYGILTWDLCMWEWWMVCCNQMNCRQFAGIYWTAN